MDYINFQVGEQFPLPIQAAGDGGMFQIDANGTMFILQLSKTDIIAAEAFRTGQMELALYEEDGILFFLYQMDGIFSAGWGDAPLALHLLKPEQLPVLAKMKDPAIHLYLVDTRLHVLIAMRTVQLNEKFFAVLRRHTQQQLEHPFPPAEYMQRVQAIWQRLSSAQMRKKAAAVPTVPLSIPGPARQAPLH